jgi:antagonist of KipI
LIALVSQNSSFKIADQEIPINRPVFIPKGLKVQLKNNTDGRYSYLAVAGGWDVPEVLGSKSTFVTAVFGGYHGRRLQKGDELKSGIKLSKLNETLMENFKGETVIYPKWSITVQQFLRTSNSIVRVILGREFDWFEDLALTDFLSKSYQLKDGNRMGYHLDGPKITRKKSHQKELLSTAVVPGIIQVTGDGSLILLMADCQTTGGYPRIAKVVEVDLPLCAQLKPGNHLHFEIISLKEAEKLYIELQSNFQKLATAIQLKLES